jgi:hypothetical protein
MLLSEEISAAWSRRADSSLNSAIVTQTPSPGHGLCRPEAPSQSSSHASVHVEAAAAQENGWPRQYTSEP